MFLYVITELNFIKRNRIFIKLLIWNRFQVVPFNSIRNRDHNKFK